MYMGVIPVDEPMARCLIGAPHVYGGDPGLANANLIYPGCSPCIWG